MRHLCNLLIKNFHFQLQNVGLLREELEIGEYQPLERYEEGLAPTITLSQSVRKCNQVVPALKYHCEIGIAKYEDSTTFALDSGCTKIGRGAFGGSNNCCSVAQVTRGHSTFTGHHH